MGSSSAFFYGTEFRENILGTESGRLRIAAGTNGYFAGSIFICLLNFVSLIKKKFNMKSWKIILSILLLQITTSSVTCRKGHGDDRLTIVNNSNKSVYVILQYNYPDTSINDKSWSSLAYTHLQVDSGSSTSLWNSIDWEEVIRGKNALSTIMIFVFDLDKVINKPWAQIQSDYDVLKRYDVTIDRLNTLDWKITYP